MVICSNVISSWSSEVSAGETEEDEELEEEKKKRKRRIKRRKVAAAGPSVFWNNCHSCRRQLETKNKGRVGNHVKCSKCPLRFCDVCLLRKHGEDAAEEMGESVRWTCPICRGGCGPGCSINCCACGPCRKLYKQLEPAGRLILPGNFSNVHDYLIHFETGESAEVIAGRKVGRGWTKATGGLVDLNFTWAIKRMRSVRCRPACIQRVASNSISQGGDQGEKPSVGGMIPKDTEVLRRPKQANIR